MALPRSLARVVEAQSHWSFRKNALITSVISFGVGGLFGTGLLGTLPIAILLVLWMLLLMPGMLIFSAIVNAKRKATSFIINLAMAIVLWWVGLVLCFYGTALLGSVAIW